jgi:hypothetical protein
LNLTIFIIKEVWMMRMWTGRLVAEMRNKAKFTPKQTMNAQRKYCYSATHSITSALDRDEWSMPRSGRFNPGKDPVPTVQEAGWASAPVWMGEKNLVLTGIRSWTVQHVASRYTD